MLLIHSLSNARTKSRMSLYFSFSFPVGLRTAILIASQLFGNEAKTISALISSSKSIFIEDSWFVMVLNSFRCYAIDTFFIKCTLLFASGFSYIPDKIFIKSAVVFSFMTLCATDLDRVNLITPSTYLSRRVHSSSFIVAGFSLKSDRCNFFP